MKARTKRAAAVEVATQEAPVAEAAGVEMENPGTLASAATETVEPSDAPVAEVAMSEPRRARSRKKQEEVEAPLEPLTDAFVAEVEAVVFASERAATGARVAAAVFRHKRRAGEDEEGAEPTASKSELAQVERAIAALNEAYEKTGRAFRIEAIAGGYRVMTLASLAEPVAAFRKAKQGGKLSKPAVESLAIIAYRQPITRQELEAIRGVSCGEVLRSLLERRLVTITGRAEELGRPMLYGTTKAFLDQFGLASLKDLPAPGELKLG